MRYHWVLFILFFGLLIVSGCAGSTIDVGDHPDYRDYREREYREPGRDNGPPPWAPAHGGGPNTVIATTLQQRSTLIAAGECIFTLPKVTGKLLPDCQDTFG